MPLPFALDFNHPSFLTLEPKKREFVKSYLSAGRNLAVVASRQRCKKEDLAPFLEDPQVALAIIALGDGHAKAAGVSLGWILQKQVEVIERCLENRPVLDKQGKVVEGKFMFDAFGANKGLENIAKFTGVVGSGGTTVNVNVANMSGDQRAMEIEEIRKRLVAREAAVAPLPESVDAEWEEITFLEENE